MPKAKVLIVEDDLHTMESLRIILTHNDYLVLDPMTNGEAAVAAAQQFQPDVVLMDVMLEGEMDGIEAADKIRSAAGIPVLYLTAYDTQELFERAKTTDPFAFMLKPFNERELLLTLEMALYRCKMEAKLRKSEQHLRDAQRIGCLGSWDWNITSNELVWSDQMFRIFGFQPQQFKSNYRNFFDRIHPQDRARVQHATDKALANEKHFFITYRVVTDSGDIRHIQAEGEVDFDSNKQPIRMLGTVQDITALKQTEKELWQQAYHDGLTGLPNRGLLQDRIVQIMANCKRSGELAAVLLLDLDNFKKINDTLGHAAGDQLLCEVSSRLKSIIREGDTLARLGGDEFVIVSGGLKSERDVKCIADKLIASIAEPLSLSEKLTSTSASIGVALFPQHGADLETLLKHADQAMYAAKSRGKNTSELYQAN